MLYAATLLVKYTNKGPDYTGAFSFDLYYILLPKD